MNNCIVAALFVFAAQTIAAQANERVDLKIDLSEANSVLSILDKRAQGQNVENADWERLFSTVPYQRLKQRESSMRRPFTDEEFKKFVPTLDARRAALRETLAAWSKTDLPVIASRPLAYLPANATIRASVYPVIKPQSNSFVFEAATNAAIFLYLDPAVSHAQFENTVAHELHHIGLASNENDYETRIQLLPEDSRKVARWMGAFGEGIAVLAAAGGMNNAPLAAYPERDQCDWNLHMDRVHGDLEQVNQFFLDVIHGDLRNDAITHVASSYFGYRGPWYTVGYFMATTIERRLGRAALVETLTDLRNFVAKYNEAAGSRAGERLPVFSSEVIEAVRK
jgi:Putative zinc dependent peptidase (DUF5700)